jgi:hypothetical protein
MRQPLIVTFTLFLCSALTLPCIANFTFAQSSQEDYNNKPSITIQSPINQTYTTSSITLNFTVTEPAAWFKHADLYSYPNILVTYGRLVSVSYILDELESENISVSEPDVWTVNFGTPNSPVDKTFSFNLTDLPGGQHSVQIIAYGSVYVSGGTSKSSDGPFSPVITAPVVTYASINFTIADDSTSNPTKLESLPQWIILPAIILIMLIVGIIIVYIRKRQGFKSIQPQTNPRPF